MRKYKLPWHSASFPNRRLPCVHLANYCTIEDVVYILAGQRTIGLREVYIKMLTGTL
ncbi:MAG: hypothetical protein QXR45_06980 [Candidatus Bathyarchaeia archaeon]